MAEPFNPRRPLTPAEQDALRDITWIRQCEPAKANNRGIAMNIQQPGLANILALIVLVVIVVLLIAGNPLSPVAVLALIAALALALLLK